MEKIYMEENQSYNRKPKRSLLSNVSIMMSFILAFVAIVSIASLGFSQMSYAIPNESVTPFPDKITTVDEDEAHTVKGFTTGSPIIALHRATVNGSTKYVFCIESDVDIQGNVAYSKKGVITDKGLLFLLTYLASDKYKIVGSNGNEVGELPRGWIVQTALWVYLHDTKYPNNVGTSSTGAAFFDDAAIALVRAEKSLVLRSDLMTPIFTESKAIYDSCKLKDSGLVDADSTITGLIAKAKRIKAGTDNWNSFDLSVSKRSDTISVTEDGKFLQSDVVTVNGSTGFKGYKINASGVPTGTKFYDTNGEELKSLDDLTNGAQFVVRVPVESLTDENKTVSLSITGAFQGETAYYYTFHNDTENKDRQQVAYTGEVVKHVNKGVDITFNYTPDVPDTGITAAQSVYFIGLIILLAGVGIIYANIKPYKVQE